MVTLPEMNYVVGRGRLFFDKFPDSISHVKSGERYLGDTSALETTQANTDLKHYSSETGLKVMDRSVTIQKDITGTFMCDHIGVENIAFWYAGETSDYAQAAASGIVESVTVQPGLWYQLGVTADNPIGVSDLASATASATIAVAASGTLTFGGQPTAADTITINGIAITFVASGAVGSQVNIGGNAAGTAQALATYINAHSDTLHVTSSGASNVLTLTHITPGTAGNALTIAKSGAQPALSGATLTGGSAGSVTALTSADWSVELDTGRFTVSDTIAPESVVAVTYATSVAAGTTVITAATELYGALRFVADNPVGANTDHYWPYVKLTSNGSFALKGDAWQQMGFNFEVLKLPTQERVYLRQRAA